jgi:transglutaminase-like putative cysteine protease
VLLFVTSSIALASGRRPILSGDDVPSWLRQAASTPHPTYENKVSAVTLLSEQSVRVDEDGRVTTTERRAVKILSGEGRRRAFARVSYLTDTGKVRDIKAWLIRPSEQVKKYGKDETLDLAGAPNDVFNEVRVKLIDASDDMEVGAIFGYEWTTEDRSVFTQFDWQFQDRMPAVLSRYSIALPTGWRAEGVTFNTPRIEPNISGSTYSWELRNLPGIEYEAASPPVTNLAPRLAVSYFAAPGKSGAGRSFEKWAEVSKWLTELSDSQASTSEPMVNKARQLVAGAKTEFEKIQAVGRFVQSVNYVSIQTGIGRGGGYRPHSAVDVFAKAYGDCKDKANLMRAMLKAAGIDSYLVSIYSGDPTYVREEWPSPQQFNHCIIAVKVGDETQAATVVRHPSIGRLLVFDPTDDNTPVGDLPDHEQGSLALIIAGDAGALLRMPEISPEANKLERRAEVVLTPDGSIAASVHERSTGQAAVVERRQFRALSRPEYVKVIEKWVTRGATGASVSKIEPSDGSAEGRFALDLEFTAARYGQLMQGRLLIFKPAIIERDDALPLTETSRKHPVVLEPRAYSETVHVKLPAGFLVDEMPDAVNLATPFGAYTTSYEVKDGHLHFSRSLMIKSATIPVSDWAKVRQFFALIRRAEESPVVLARK